MLAFLLSFLVPPVTWAVWSVYTLSVNYAAAKKIGVPIVILPVSSGNPVWMLLADIIVPLLQKNSTIRSWPLVRFGRRSWEFKDKGKIHQEIGDLFVMVTPVKNWLYVCNADILAEIMQRRNEFIRPKEILELLNVFGPNISTVFGRDWQRHKKATGPPFNEQNSKIVWDEALRQGREALQHWKEKSLDAVRTTAEDAKTFSLNVISCAGFRKSYSFLTKEGAVGDEDHSMTYKKSLSIILENAILILILGPKFLVQWRAYLPKSWMEVGQATIEFKAYMSEMLKEERRLIAEGKPSAGNLMTSLIRASEEQKGNEKNENGEGRLTGLSEEEIFGNIFVFNFAGHDTISHTLAYAIHLLAAHPHVQDWLSEEIKLVFPDPDNTTWNYEDFPKLKRCMATLLETVRLYNPLLSFIKGTGDLPRTLNYNSMELHLPPNTVVIPSLLAIQSDQRYWGSDSLIWRPQRWLSPPKDPLPASNELSEEFWTPVHGSYYPWSDGPRGCPGKKFSQVEFVAAIATLFRDHRIDILREDGESKEEAERRVQEVVDDSAMVLLLQILRPASVGLKWVRR